MQTHPVAVHAKTLGEVQAGGAPMHGDVSIVCRMIVKLYLSQLMGLPIGVAEV